MVMVLPSGCWESKGTVTVPHFCPGFRVAPGASGGQAPHAIEVWTFVRATSVRTVPEPAPAVWAEQAVAATAAMARAAAPIRCRRRARGTALRDLVMMVPSASGGSATWIAAGRGAGQ